MSQRSLSHSIKAVSKKGGRIEAYNKADMNRVATLILSGGQGSRLFPLTAMRCKPAIVFGGKFRLIDVALSNAIHSGCNKIFVITQFLSASLHKHICVTYQGHSVFSKGFVDLLSAEQNNDSKHWFTGTADAVRKNLFYLEEVSADYILILSGDQIYTMDFSYMLRYAIEKEAAVVVASTPIEESGCSRMGLVSIDDRFAIKNFIEKPQQKQQLTPYLLNEMQREQMELVEEDSRSYLASMGIYLFRRDVLDELLQDDLHEDFGKHLLPCAIERLKDRCFAYVHDSFWEDVGTIRSFYDVNMLLTKPHPPINFYDERWPIYQAPTVLPGAKCYNAKIDHSILCAGSLIEGAFVRNSVVGLRCCIGKECHIEDCYLLGNDHYTAPQKHTKRFPEKMQISAGCTIKRAIIDKEVYIGKNVRLVNEKGLSHFDGDGVYIRDGVIVVQRGASIPDDFVL